VATESLTVHRQAALDTKYEHQKGGEHIMKPGNQAQRAASAFIESITVHARPEREGVISE
jgi:hypothetical protein